jgi:flagellar protein FliS
MSKPDTAFAYQQSSAFGASAVGQVVALYDRILRDFRQAIQAVEAGQVEARANSLKHALTIIGELQGVLDFEQGGESARHLNGFYNVSRGMVMQAGITSSVAVLQELVSMFTRLRAAWAKIESSVAPAEPTQHVRITNRPQLPPPQSAPISAEAEPSSGSGWRA